MSNTWYAPESLIHDKMGNFYRNHTVASRVIGVTVGIISGALKPLLFPIAALIAVVVMPIIAVIRAFCGKKDSFNWIQAWSFSLIAVIGVSTYFCVSAFHLPLVASATIFVGGTSISIVIHVYNWVKTPPLKQSSVDASLIDPSL